MSDPTKKKKSRMFVLEFIEVYVCVALKTDLLAERIPDSFLSNNR